MFRPSMPIVATTPDDRSRRQLALSWGVRPVLTEYAHDIETILEDAVTAALDRGGAKTGDTLVVIAGMLTQLNGTNTTNTLKIHIAAETVATGSTVVTGSAAGPVYRSEDGSLNDIPTGAVLVIESAFDESIESSLETIAGIIDARSRTTGHPADIAREVGIPMVSNAQLPKTVANGDIATIDGERGVVYYDDIIESSDTL